MPLFQRLYNTVWLAFFSCVLLPRWMGLYPGAPIHVALGILMLFMTITNARRLAVLPVPARLKRISKTMAGIASFQAVCGVAFGGVKHMLPDVPVVGTALQVAHIVCALALVAQSGSLATGYDMWEEKETGEAPASGSTKAAETK